MVAGCYPGEEIVADLLLRDAQELADPGDGIATPLCRATDIAAQALGADAEGICYLVVVEAALTEQRLQLPVGIAPEGAGNGG